MTAPRTRNGKPPPYAPPGFHPRLRAALVRVAGSDAPGWQCRAADRLGVSHAVVCFWANGVQPPGLTTVAEIVRLSGVNAHWLLTGAGPVDAPGAPTAPHAGRGGA